MPGLVALAIAMGIGRFAFTPLLPMMQSDAGLGVAQGGWLASANYVGYLAGALLALRLDLPASRVVRGGLALVAVVTAAMAFTHSLAAWMALRFAAGIASAWVLVFVSSWGFARPEIVFAGVGTGIAVTGLACLVLMAHAAASDTAWITLGALAALGTVAIWPAFGARPVTAGGRVSNGFAWTPEAWRLVACYGAFGFGYIIPATFLPAMAKQVIDDPVKFGWSWPLFGAAALLSTLAAGTVRKRFGDRRTWIAAHVVMAIGVAVPLAVPGLTGILVSALLVGGTFMVATMAGVQEARRVAGNGARTLIAAVTSTFALGQIAGPVVVGLFDDLSLSLMLAASLLLASAFFLRRTP